MPDPWLFQEETQWDRFNEDFEVYQYQEENLVIDLIDASNDQVIWKGNVTRILSSYDDKNREETLKEAISTLFNDYPFRVGAIHPLSLNK